jgi:hypothetical protein
MKKKPVLLNFGFKIRYVVCVFFKNHIIINYESLCKELKSLRVVTGQRFIHVLKTHVAESVMSTMSYTHQSALGPRGGLWPVLLFGTIPTTLTHTPCLLCSQDQQWYTTN